MLGCRRAIYPAEPAQLEKRTPRPSGGGVLFDFLCPEKTKKPFRKSEQPSCLQFERSLDGAGYLAGTNAAGAGVNVLGRTVYHSLNSSYIGLPGPVGSSMRMGNLNAESNTLTADVALCHLSAPPSGYR